MNGALVLLVLGAAAGSSELRSPVRVEPRLLVKERHVFMSVGGVYFHRADYYMSPGVVGSVAFYPTKRDGLELSVGYFFSSLSPAAQEVIDATGLALDAHRPVALARAGWRRSLGYGKVLVDESADRVFHFDVQLFGRGGVAVTDQGVGPSVGLGPALLIRLGARLFAQLDLEVGGSLEQRRVLTFAPHAQLTFAVGGVL